MTIAALPAAGRVDGAAFKAAFRRHPGGVAVVTFDGPSGPGGFTATSVISLSLEPPLLAFAVGDGASAWQVLREAHSAVVHLLDHEQDAVAECFATRGIDRFASPTRWDRLVTGEPYLLDAPIRLRVALTDRIALGDHHLIVGAVQDAVVARESAPLVHHAGAFHTVRTLTHVDRGEN